MCVWVTLCSLGGVVYFTFVQTAVDGVWRWRMSPIPPSPPSDSNLCSFSDKSRHLVVLAWDAGCTMGCCKLCAWSGPGTPHLMGNSLNSAHLGRQRRLGPLVFLAAPASHRPPLPPPTYPAATVPGRSPRAVPAYLRPLAHAALAILIKLSSSASGQAYTNRPSYPQTEHSVYCLLGPNKSSCHRQQPRAHSPMSWKADYCPGRITQLQPHISSLCSTRRPQCVLQGLALR